MELYLHFFPPYLLFDFLLRDGKKATDMDMNLPQRMAVKELLKKIEGTDIELILKQYNVI